MCHSQDFFFWALDDFWRIGFLFWVFLLLFFFNIGEGGSSFDLFFLAEYYWQLCCIDWIRKGLIINLWDSQIFLWIRANYEWMAVTKSEYVKQINGTVSELYLLFHLRWSFLWLCSTPWGDSTLHPFHPNIFQIPHTPKCFSTYI